MELASFQVAVFAVAALAGAVAALSGFGIGSLLTPLLALRLATDVAVAAVAIPHAVGTVLRWYPLRHDVHGPTFRQFGLASAVGGFVGAALHARIGSPALTIIFSSLLVFAGTSELTGRTLPFPATPTWRLIGGSLSGLFGGLVGNQGGIRAAALLGFPLKPNQLVATATASALLVDAARLPVYLISTHRELAATAEVWLSASLGVVPGTVFGVRLLKQMPERVFRSFLGAVLITVGLGLLIAAIH